jgi:NAD(P)H dehydrogenase (quinone)
MSKLLVLYHSIHGHIEQLAQSVADGAREYAGTDVIIKRVPETLDPEVLQKIGAKVDQKTPVASIEELANYDAIIFGTPTRFGNMTGQMRMFLDRAGVLWQEGALVGKIGSVFTSSATQHGGQESTILTFHPTLLHLGMIIVGLPYTAKAQMGIKEVNGGSPYGTSTITGSDGKRWPSETELGLARFQGRHVAEIASSLAAGKT